MGRDDDDEDWFSFARDEPLRVPSPGGWAAPTGSRPGWSWSPEGGLGVRLDRMPWWVRIWMRLPIVDRRAHVYCWYHGGFDVAPAQGFQVAEHGWSSPFPRRRRSMTRRRRFLNEWGFQQFQIEPGGWLMLLVPGALLGLVVGQFVGASLLTAAALGAAIALLAIGVGWCLDTLIYRRRHGPQLR